MKVTSHPSPGPPLMVPSPLGHIHLLHLPAFPLFAAPLVQSPSPLGHLSTDPPQAFEPLEGNPRVDQLGPSRLKCWALPRSCRKISMRSLVLGKRPGHQKCLTGFLMAKRSQAGFPDPNEAGGGSPHPDRVGGVFYTIVVRDGQARRTGVRIGHQAKASRADRSFFVADVGQLYLGKCAVIGPQDLGGSFR